MKQYLRISDTLNLPANGVTQTFACIGRKGAGKTYLASMLAEQMLDIGAQIVIIDPVGNWWGLRVDAESLAEYMGTTVRARGFEENLRRLRNDDLLVGSKESLKVAEWLR